MGCMRTIRWGIIGCGNVCEVKSGPGLQKARGSALAAVMRRDAAKAADYARRHGVPRWYDDAAALVADPEVDAVYVATPPGSHLEYARLAASAGKPVYVEKPMARTHAECLEMVAACREAGVPLFVAYYRRCLPRFLAVREAVRAGRIGTPVAARVSFLRPVAEKERGPDKPWRVDPEQSGGGHIWDMGSHALDYLDYLLGPVEWASGKAANFGGVYGPEDTVCGAFRFASGCLGTGVWGFAAGVSEDCLEIIGTEGHLSMSVFGTEPVELAHGETVERIEAETPDHVQQPLIQTIVDELNGSGTCPSTGESAARTNWVLEQLTRS
jgi:1,5-anhydro-D-fructose reductase (1,5-anhydro-D-mannitol-forming)